MSRGRACAHISMNNIQKYVCTSKKKLASLYSSRKFVVNVLFLIAFLLSSRRELPFIKTAHLSNPWNEHKPVKIGRDGQVGGTLLLLPLFYFPLDEAMFNNPPPFPTPTHIRSTTSTARRLRRSNRTSALSCAPSFRWTRAWTSTRLPATSDTSVGHRQKRGPGVARRSANREG